MCDVCGMEIDEGEEYIETDDMCVYCSEVCLLEDLEQREKIEYKVND